MLICFSRENAHHLVQVLYKLGTRLGSFELCEESFLLVSNNLTDQDSDQARLFTKQGCVASHCQVEILEFTMKYCTALASAKHTAENPL